MHKLKKPNKMHQLSHKTKTTKFLGGMGLIIGTAIGAGMLGLPVDTAKGGYLPSIVFFLICYIVMTISGLMVLKAVKYFKKEANFSSLVNGTLGKWALPFVWVVYLALLYSLVFVYVKGMIGFVRIFLPPENDISYALVSIFFILCLYLGPKIIERVNSIFLVGLVASFLLIISLGVRFVNIDFLINFTDWKMASLSLPIIITSFGFHIVIPTVYSYFEKDYKKTKYAIIIGTSLCFIGYLIWQTIIMGIIPRSDLLLALKNDLTAINPLTKVLNNKSVVLFGKFFGFCALATSLLGVSISLFDFLSDGLRLAKRKRNKFLLAVIIILPPILLSMTKLPIFYLALRYGAGLSVNLLLILLPTLMIWELKKQHRDLRKDKLFSYYLLVLMLVFVLFEFAIEVIHLII